MRTRGARTATSRSPAWTLQRLAELLARTPSIAVSRSTSSVLLPPVIEHLALRPAKPLGSAWPCVSTWRRNDRLRRRDGRVGLWISTDLRMLVQPDAPADGGRGREPESDDYRHHQENACERDAEAEKQTDDHQSIGSNSDTGKDAGKQYTHVTPHVSSSGTTCTAASGTALRNLSSVEPRTSNSHRVRADWPKITWVTPSR